MVILQYNVKKNTRNVYKESYQKTNIIKDKSLKYSFGRRSDKDNKNLDIATNNLKEFINSLGSYKYK